MTTHYTPDMTEPWTFPDAVDEITYTSRGDGMSMPPWIRDNRPGSNLLVLDFDSAEKMRAWYEYFGVRQHRADPPVWAWGWHGWTVMLSVLPTENSASGKVIDTPDPGAVATRPEPPAVAAAVLTPDAAILPGSAMCRVPHVRAGDGPSIVVRCARRAGHLGDHVDLHNRAWANEYTPAVNV